jgi:hypothetical protein
MSGMGRNKALPAYSLCRIVFIASNLHSEEKEEKLEWVVIIIGST